MKEYMKPEVEVVDFATEAVALDIGEGDVLESGIDVPRPGHP